MGKRPCGEGGDWRRKKWVTGSVGIDRVVFVSVDENTRSVSVNEGCGLDDGVFCYAKNLLLDCAPECCGSSRICEGKWTSSISDEYERLSISSYGVAPDKMIDCLDTKSAIMTSRVQPLNRSRGSNL